MPRLTFSPMEVSTQLFSWSRQHGGSMELSDVGPRRHAPIHSRLYDDAIDEGFILVSHRTGRRLVMLLSRTDESEGDVAGWHYVAWLEQYRDGHLRTLEESERVEVLVIND